MTDGSWVAFVVDQSSALDAEANAAASIQFGTSCTTTLTSGSAVSWTNGGNNTWASDTDCTNPGTTYTAAAMNAVGDAPSIVKAGTTSTDGPSLNGQTGIDLPHWPIVTGFEFSATNYITFGDDTVVVTYGPEEAGSSIITPDIVTQGENVAVEITDNGLNIDPTIAETWTFTTSTTARTTGATTDIDAHLATLGFGDNGIIGVTDGGSALTSGTTYVFVETGLNTGVFTTHDAVGESTVDTKTNADVDDVVTLTYGGNTAQFVVATSNATASLDAGAEWMPAEPAVYTITDPDMNRNASDVETLYISSDNIVPTIKIGTPLWLSKGILANAGLGTSSTGISFASNDSFAVSSVADMADDSGRVKLTLTAGSASTEDTFSIFTGWDASTKTGSEVLFYDICSITDNIGSTAIELAIDGTNVLEPGSTATSGSGNACSGEVQYTSGTTTITSTTDSAVALVFTITMDSATGTAGDYVIAADLNNYDQGVASNSITRVEAVETGVDTGVFQGTVTYGLLNTVAGETGAADFTHPEDEDVIIMLDTYYTGSSGPRVNFGDTDVLGLTNVTVGAQLDANTHSGVVTWDQTSYAVGDAATVTVVDADLNTDNTIIETYVGDSSLDAGTDIFTIQCNDAVCSTDVTVKLVEDGTDSDTFIGVFTVPDDIGEDMEIGYRDSRDAAGTAVIWYATSTINSTTGSVSLDRQVYPVPFDDNELKTGANANLSDFNGDSTTGDDGDVTVWVQVTDDDFTDDELKADTAPGTVNLITSGTTTAIYTFGGITASGTELGPMTEVEQGSNVYEISFTVDETQSSHQVQGGKTVIQVKYADANGDNGLATNVFDSSTFDLRNGELTADKSVYIMGQEMVLTLN